MTEAGKRNFQMRILMATIFLVLGASELSADLKFKKIYETCKNHSPTKPLNAQSMISAVKSNYRTVLKNRINVPRKQQKIV